ncbi:MAG TPA: hypothetical protein VIG25_11100 [Pyrinomonadaceae bacterium]
MPIVGIAEFMPIADWLLMLVACSFARDSKDNQSAIGNWKSEIGNDPNRQSAIMSGG